MRKKTFKFLFGHRNWRQVLCGKVVNRTVVLLCGATKQNQFSKEIVSILFHFINFFSTCTWVSNEKTNTRKKFCSDGFWNFFCCKDKNYLTSLWLPRLLKSSMPPSRSKRKLSWMEKLISGTKFLSFFAKFKIENISFLHLTKEAASNIFCLDASDLEEILFKGSQICTVSSYICT